MRKGRILVVVRYLSAQGGVQGVINNYYKRFDREKFDIDYLTLETVDQEFEEQVRRSGANIYRVRGVPERNLFLLEREVRRFFCKNNGYDILHCHQTNFDTIFLYHAYRSHVPVRILHAHSTSADIPSIQLCVERFGAKRFATHIMACSMEAAVFLTGGAFSLKNDVIIVNNAFDVGAYEYCPSARKKIRERYHISDSTCVVGQIGRLSPEKRHIVSLRAVQRLRLEGANIVFVIAGDGPERREISEAIRAFGLCDSVLLVGSIRDVPQLLSALDVYIMPSRFEGVPMALLEALANGCPAVVSDSIQLPICADVGVVVVPTDAGPAEWSRGIRQANDVGRLRRMDSLKAEGYDIERQVSRLESVYEELIDCSIDDGVRFERLAT